MHSNHRSQQSDRPHIAQSDRAVTPSELLSGVEVGEEWAYRERPRSLGDPVHRVTIVKIRDSDDSIRIRRLDGDDAGLQEWVSYTSLLDRWTDIEPRLNDERRLLAVREASSAAGDTVEYNAALLIVKNCGLGRRVIFGRSKTETGVLRIDKPAGVADRLGLTVEELADDPLAFHDRHGTLISPWRAARQLMPTIATTFSEGIMEAIHREEAELRSENLYGYPYRPSWEDASALVVAMLEVEASCLGYLSDPDAVFPGGRN
ncbi:hypothetical protein [Nonomuraea sp. 10N515B]|uniref:hypothetical protein n=1 Tax=Nonomuraea sp. 10N515B TaxID=3457422 RepID=UPI003FCE7053